MITVKRYSPENKEVWDEFNKNSKSYLFMFDRNYMDYHKDRFKDHSLIFYSDSDIIALFPACEISNSLCSHAGLTFGGFISDSKMKQHVMQSCFTVLIDYCKNNGFSKIIYKKIPYIYCSQPAEEDIFSLFANNAVIRTVDASTFLDLKNPLKMPKGRRAQISRAKREGVIVQRLESQSDYDNFIKLENKVLEERHSTHAVHTSKELMYLHKNFPDNIHLYGALKEGKLIAGTIIFEYDNVIHTQYMAADDEARKIGALDLAVFTVMEIYKNSKNWLDFGISTEHGRIYLNEGLISQKEGFGGRTGCYQIWELSV